MSPGFDDFGFHFRRWSRRSGKIVVRGNRVVLREVDLASGESLRVPDDELQTAIAFLQENGASEGKNLIDNRQHGEDGVLHAVERHEKFADVIELLKPLG